MATQIELTEEADTAEKRPQGVEHAETADPDPRSERVTAKAWLSVFFLSLSFGAPFWATATMPNIAAQLMGRFGNACLASWVVPTITTAATVMILLFGATSDLFGRRPFLLASNALCMVGYAVLATAASSPQLLAGLALNGAGSGTAGVALVACPELLPNRFRHIGVVLADGFVYLMIVIGPVVARAAIVQDDHRWIYLYWAGFVVSTIALAGLAILYFPPKHPRGVPWRDAVRGMDWIGAALFTPACVLFSSAVRLLLARSRVPTDRPPVVYTTDRPAHDIHVILCLTLGFVLLVAFALWEHFSGVRFPLCPTAVFTSHRGREFTAPFCLSFIVVGFFYGLAVIYPTMLNDFYIDASTSNSMQMLLTLPSSLGLPLGGILLTLFGHRIGHWYWTLVASVTALVVWGSLMALVTPTNKALMIALVVLGQVAYGWAAYLAVTVTQLGVPQPFLGIAGGLAGLARYAGGAVASACYASAIGNGLHSRGAALIPAAARAAGLPDPALPQLMDAVFANGPAAIGSIPGVTPAVVDAVSAAYKSAAAFGLRNAALASLAFGVVGIGLALYCEDITPKMNNKIEVFLENDALAEKNTFH